MPNWEGSDRKSRLPREWHKIRSRVRRRAGGRCEHIADGKRCQAKGTDVDHIMRGDDHVETNLQLLCKPHHASKSSSEGGSAKRKPRRGTKRPQERHPGLA